jgi:hypothetical protein
MKATADRPDGESRDDQRPRPRSAADGAGAGAGPVRTSRRVPTARSLLALQRSAGNAAVAGLIARSRAGTGGAGATSGVAEPANGAVTQSAGDVGVQRRADGGGHPSPPPRPGPVDPHGDPRFAKLVGKVGDTAKTARAHPAPKGEAKKAADAALPPAGDRDAQAKAAQVEKMAGAKPAGFDKVAFMAAVRAAIAAKAPKNLDEADKFAESGRADGVKAEVMGNVAKGKEASAKDIATKTSEAPDPSVAKEKPVTPLSPDPVPKPPVPAAGAGMPAPAPAEQTDLGAPKAETNAQMAEADVSEDQLARSNEPEFTGALAAKKAGEEHSATAPSAVRAGETATLQGAAGGADQAAANLVGQMAGKKAAVTSQASGQKEEARSADTAARERIKGELTKIFADTKTEVTKILTDLDAAVATRFDEGEKVAKAAFTADHKARMERYKDERYEGVLGAGRWVADKFAGLPAEANQLFQESRKLYEAKMEGVISSVADLIGGELARAKGVIARGRESVARHLAAQPKELAKVAGQAAKDIGGEFDKLEADVDDKQSQLVDDLAQRYVDARSAVDEEIKALQDENKGLWDKAKEAVGGAIETILKLKSMLLGVLSRAAGAVGKIIKDPIGFLGNLIGAVKSGVMGFAANIVEHLKKGLQGWLFGSLADAGIEIPDSFDIKGIIKLVLSILGLTWTRIRTKIVGRIGEAAMNAVEKGSEIFKTLVTEGVGGLWKFLVDKLSDLKDTVMSAIQDFVVVKIVKAGITWLISALNPAAAFIKACKMIYDVVMFFVEKGSQIKEFVDSVLDSIESIAGGGVGAVAKHIENTLAKILPLLIGFLASLLGLGGISEKIKEILKKVQEPVEKAVDFVINGALKLARPIINLVKRGAAWVKGKYEKGKAWVKGKVEAGKAWVKGKVGLGQQPDAGGAAASTITVPVTMHGAGHSLTARPGPPFELVMASTPGRIPDKVGQALSSAREQKRAIEQARAELAELTTSKRKPGRRAQLECFVTCAAKQHEKKGVSQEQELNAIVSLGERIEQRGRVDPLPVAEVTGLMHSLAGALESYANRYDVTDLGPMTAKQAKEAGSGLPYQEAKTGRSTDWGTLEAEHIAPGKVLSLVVRDLSGKVIYVKDEDNPSQSQYHRDWTILVPKLLADIKTDEGGEGVLSDQAEIRRVKAMAARVDDALASGEAVDPADALDLNSFVTQRMGLTIQARNRLIARVRSGSVNPPPGMSADAYANALADKLPEGRIRDAALRQLQNLWDLAKKAETAASAGAAQGAKDCACD